MMRAQDMSTVTAGLSSLVSTLAGRRNPKILQHVRLFPCLAGINIGPGNSTEGVVKYAEGPLATVPQESTRFKQRRK